MVDMIEIHIIENFKEFNMVIDANKLEVNSNGIVKHISKGTIFKLLSIIKNWKNEYKDETVIDAPEFTVIVRSFDGIVTYHGKGVYPKNYRVFKTFIGGIR